jgi:two-component system chemotaxis sensor kinase CheA
MALSVTQALKISVCDKIFFLPVNMVEKIIKVSENNLPVVEGFPAIRYLDSHIPYVRLSSLLKIPEPESSEGDENFKRPVVIVGTEKNRAALGIDLFIGEEEILIKGLGNLMKKVRNISGVTVMRDGNISPILNVVDMVKTVQHRGIAAPKKFSTKTNETSSILVVDDSIMTRTLQMNIIESYGYNVVTAVDGKDALSKVQENNFDLIVSDIQMPNMNGLEFTEKIKSDDRYKKIPVILVTALESDEDKKRGIEVGADAYIIKSSFDQSNLLNTIKRLL